MFVKTDHLVDGMYACALLKAVGSPTLVSFGWIFVSKYPAIQIKGRILLNLMRYIKHNILNPSFIKISEINIYFWYFKGYYSGLG